MDTDKQKIAQIKTQIEALVLTRKPRINENPQTDAPYLMTKTFRDFFLGGKGKKGKPNVGQLNYTLSLEDAQWLLKHIQDNVLPLLKLEQDFVNQQREAALVARKGRKIREVIEKHRKAHPLMGV